MASVHSSRSRAYAAGATDDDEAPQHVQSQGELLIKQMVQKQMDTRLTLDEQLTHQKEFEKAIEFEPLTKYFSGQSTLKEFQESSTKVSRKEYLQSLGLTSEEIELVLDQEKGDDVLLTKHKNIEKSILFTHLKEINTKIKEAEAKHVQKDDETTLSYTGVSRHERELGLAVKPDSTHTRLYQFALSCQPSTSDVRPPSHPIHHLKDIEQEMFGHLKRKRRRTRKPNLESKQPMTASSTLLSLPVIPVHLSTNTVSDTRSSQWDVKEATEPKRKTNKVYEKKVYSCKPEVLYTIRNKKIVPLKDVISTAKNLDCGESSYSGQPFVMSNKDSCETVLPRERITEAEIKALPKFLNYDRGIPSKVLYVKNLHKSVKEDDLVQLFRTFESPDEPRIVYRLMAGKMKGQAFITFNNNDRATTAIDGLNGCILKGQPIVIQFGKSTSQPEERK